MSVIIDLTPKVEEVLDRELKITSENIKQNMQRNNQVATRRTIASINHKAIGVYGYIAGAEHIDTLEKGISPERSMLFSWKQTFAGLYRWAPAKGLRVTSRVLANMVNTQRQVGSVLFRKGGRFDVYSNEVDPLIERIKNAIGNIIINTKIIE